MPKNTSFRRRWMHFLFLLIAIALGSYSYWHYNYGYREREIRNALIDPDSAVFRNRHRGDSGEFFCAEVNSKNRYGGFVGFQRVVAGSGYVFLENGGLSEVAEEVGRPEGYSVMALRVLSAKYRAEEALLKAKKSYTDRDLEKLAIALEMNELWKEKCQ